MTFDAIDAVLGPWLARRGLQVFTAYKDEPVRTLQIVNAKGQKVQLWIDPPPSQETVRVHVWDYGKRRQDLEGPVDELPNLLDSAYEAARHWLGI